MGKATAGHLVAAWWRAVVTRLAPRATAAGTSKRARQKIRQTRKFRAVLTMLPAADGSEPPRLTWPAWRAVVRAPNHATQTGQLCSALIAAEDGGPPPGQAHVVVTMVVVGPSPDDCLDVGDAFTLWRGRDIARGVISRRLYV